MVLCALLLAGMFLTVSASEAKTETLERFGILKGTEVAAATAVVMDKKPECRCLWARFLKLRWNSFLL